MGSPIAAENPFCVRFFSNTLDMLNNPITPNIFSPVADTKRAREGNVDTAVRLEFHSVIAVVFINLNINVVY